MKEQAKQILHFLHLAEKLKDELRHGWSSQGKQESVAEHTWRVSLMVVVCSSSLERKVDIEKSLKMAIVHDLVEAVAGDLPYFETPSGSEAEKDRRKKEQEAILRIQKNLDEKNGKQIFKLWQEFEQGDSYEARFVRALDKMEAHIQQNEADIETWLEYEAVSSLYYIDKFCNYDPFLKSLKEEIQQESIDKIRTTKKFNLEEIRQKAEKRDYLKINEKKPDFPSDVINVRKMRQYSRRFVSKRKWDKYHTPKNIAIGLALESNELLEIFQWLNDEEALKVKDDKEKIKQIKEEMGDIMHYMVRLSDILDIDMETAFWEKMKKTEKKYPVNLCKGKKEKYDELELVVE